MACPDDSPRIVRAFFARLSRRPAGRASLLEAWPATVDLELTTYTFAAWPLRLLSSFPIDGAFVGPLPRIACGIPF